MRFFLIVIYVQIPTLCYHYCIILFLLFLTIIYRVIYFLHNKKAADSDSGKTLYKFQHDLLPNAFNSYFNRPRHQHLTRFAKQLNFEVVRITFAREKSLLKYIGPKIWSEVPLPIKKSRSLKIFVSSYRTHLLESYDPPWNNHTYMLPTLLITNLQLC